MKLKEAVIKKSNKAIHILGRFRVKIIVIQMITRAHMLMQAGLQYKQYKISIYFVYCFLLIDPYQILSYLSKKKSAGGANAQKHNTKCSPESQK